MRLAGHVAWMWLVIGGRTRKKTHLEKEEVDGWIIRRWTLERWGGVN
jgi:hypothetical protein